MNEGTDRLHWIIKGAATVFFVAVLVYIFMAQSPEFGRYSPVPLTDVQVRILAAAFGVLGALVTHGMAGIPRTVALVAVTIGPAVGYGILLVCFWSALGTGLMDVIVVTAARRALSMYVTTGILTTVGAAAGIGLSSWILHD